ncbi:CvpA family protein [Neisseriaceae bacterium ESL0693]|nr:CvpA family protein [Neisseriaceae bacterium ESL0693]
MTLFDLLALGVIAVCVIISMMRGLVAEVASLLCWVAAFILGRLFANDVADVVFRTMQPRALAVGLSFMLIFIAAWIGQRLLRSLVTSVLSAIGLGGINRALGACFGLIKGTLIVTLVVLVCSFTDLPQTQPWRESQSAVWFENLARLALPYLPSFVATQWSGGSMN